MSQGVDSNEQLMSKEEIRSSAEMNPDAAGDSLDTLIANNRLMRGQIHQQQRLEIEVNELHENINSFNFLLKLVVILLLASIVIMIAVEFNTVEYILSY